MPQAAESITDCDRATAALAEFQDGLLPLMLRPAPPPREPVVEGTAVNLRQIIRLRAEIARVRGRAPVAYDRAVGEQRDALVAELLELAAHEASVEEAIGMDLFVLKEGKPEGLSWGAYLKDMGLPWKARRADVLIQVFKDPVKALKDKEKHRESERRRRARSAAHAAHGTVDSKGKNGSAAAARGNRVTASDATFGTEGSACAINWENHREDDTETDATVRARAADWQLFEALRLAEEFALFRDGATKAEFKRRGVLSRAKKVHAAWGRLVKRITAEVA